MVKPPSKPHVPPRVSPPGRREQANVNKPPQYSRPTAPPKPPGKAG